MRGLSEIQVRETKTLNCETRLTQNCNIKCSIHFSFEFFSFPFFTVQNPRGNGNGKNNLRVT